MIISICYARWNVMLCSCKILRTYSLQLTDLYIYISMFAYNVLAKDFVLKVLKFNSNRSGMHNVSFDRLFVKIDNFLKNSSSDNDNVNDSVYLTQANTSPQDPSVNV